MSDGHSIPCRAPTMYPFNSFRIAASFKYGTRFFVLKTTCKMTLVNDCGMALFPRFLESRPVGALRFFTIDQPRANAPWAIEFRPLGAERRLRRRKLPDEKWTQFPTTNLSRNGPIVQHAPCDISRLGSSRNHCENLGNGAMKAGQRRAAVQSFGGGQRFGRAA